MLAGFQNWGGDGGVESNVAGVEGEDNVLAAANCQALVLNRSDHVGDTTGLWLGQSRHLGFDAADDGAVASKLGVAVDGRLGAVDSNALQDVLFVAVVLVDGGELHTCLALFGEADGHVAQCDGAVGVIDLRAVDSRYLIGGLGDLASAARCESKRRSCCNRDHCATASGGLQGLHVYVLHKVRLLVD
ncbi:hypothetical protein BGK43_07900 [Corynebacterium diphtheriae]|nr:hypothetical protein BGK43_07900 [Corynebacterium diphtheriae]